MSSIVQVQHKVAQVLETLLCPFHPFCPPRRCFPPRHAPRNAQVNENLLAKKVTLQKMTSEVQRENDQLETALRQLLPHVEKNEVIKNEIARMETRK